MTERPQAAEPSVGRRRGDQGWQRPQLTAVLVAAVLGVLVTAATGLPDATVALPAIARHAMVIALPRWGTTEVVSEIVYGSRGWDTFGETFLLLAAVVTVVVLSRQREPRAEYVGEARAGREEQAEADPGDGADSDEAEARSAEKREDDGSDAGGNADETEDPDSEPLSTPAPEHAAGMTVLVRVGARMAAVVLSVIAVYLAAWGYTPGGGFPAGAALTGVAILLYAALGQRAVGVAVRPSALEPWEMAGAAIIIATGLGGLIRRGSFLQNWLPLVPQQMIRSGGTLQVFSGAELLEVATGLTIAIFALLGMQHDWTPDEDDESDDRDEDGSSS